MLSFSSATLYRDMRLTEFRNTIDQYRRLIAAGHVMDAKVVYSWPGPDRLVVVERLFEGLHHMGNIQEKAFIEYIMGTTSAAGNIVARYAQPTDRAHALKMLIGFGRFFDWSTPDPVRRLANNFVSNGEPSEGVLAAIQSDLMDLKTIRNAAAHLSTTTAQPLDALASRKLQRDVTSISAAAFLLSRDPASGGAMSVFESYVGLLDVAAHRIVHAKVGRKSRESKCRFWCRFVLQNTAKIGARQIRGRILLSSFSISLQI
jgi:hypothetical protein